MIKVVFSDSHITEDSLLELEEIFKEICMSKGDILICCGDYYNSNHPTAKELEFGTKWAYFFEKLFDKVIFIRGNHDKINNVSAIDYLQYFGIEVKDEYVDEDGVFYGHCFTEKSKMEYGTHTKTTEELHKYKYAILGHNHSWENVTPRIFHIGSCRFVNFNESKDNAKYYVLKFHQAEWDRKTIHSAIPMKDFISIEELAKQKNHNIKARLIITSYSQFKKEINTIEEYKNKFKEFKLKLDIKDKMIITNDIDITKQKKIEDIIKEGLEQILDYDIRALIEEAMKDDNKTIS